MIDISREITYCIKTINRPWSCNRLVASIFDRVGDAKIIVVDDGPPAERFSVKYPEAAERCRVINTAKPDVGVGVGRNLAVDAVETEYLMLFDDDHVVSGRLNIPTLCERMEMFKMDILGVRQDEGGQPMMLTPIMGGSRVWMHRGETRREGATAWCSMVSNCFLAKAETIQSRARWDEAIKTYEHWEYFYRASCIERLDIAVATDCFIEHKHVGGKNYRVKRSRDQFRKIGLRKHGFNSMRYPHGGVVHA